MTKIEMQQLLNDMQAIKATNQVGVNNASLQSSPSNAVGFDNLLTKAIDNVNEAQMHTQKLAKGLEFGDPDVSLPQVMIAAQKSSVSFQALAEVRNKFISAYQEIMNMPL